jgi:hypothetical protein
MIYNILGEQDSCDITQSVYLVPPTIYNILGEQNKLPVWCNSYTAPLEYSSSWVELINCLCDVTAILLT